VQIRVLIPIFNDWASATQLLEELDLVAGERRESYSVMLVDDGSNDAGSIGADFVDSLQHIDRVELVQLVANFGHATALAIGLGAIAERDDYDAVVVLDADGEDRPEDVGLLLDALIKSPDSVVVARRAQRSEGLQFRISYLVYKAVYYCLTGIRISFGNFCVLPRGVVQKLVYSRDLWSHLAATILKTKLPLAEVPTMRGNRYFGDSKMDTVALVKHGLGAIAVNLETVLVRVLLALLSFSAIIFSGMSIVVAVRFATELAIPGWASNVFGALAILLGQSIVFSVLLVFTSLKGHGGRIDVPALHYRDYIARVDEVGGASR
jgi:glycosyltransferase involved in cell wall biosynthesis